VFARIVSHELRVLRADRIAWIVIVLFALATGYAVWNGAERVREERAGLDRYKAVHEALVERYRQRAEAIERVEAGGTSGPFYLHRNEFTWGPRQPGYVPAWAPFFAALPPAPAAVLAVGQSDIYPPVFTVRTFTRELQPAVEPNGNPLKLLQGHFDLAFTILYLYPLFILALSFDLAASEREQGTLALLLSQPVSARSLLLGKSAARALLVLGTTFGCVALGCFLMTSEIKSADILPRLILWCLAVTVYGATWFGLALWINSFGKGSTFNALSSISCWLAFTLLLPAMLLLTASWLHPLPAKAEMVEAQRAADFEASERRSQLDPEEQERLLARFIEENPDLQRPGAWNEKGRFYLVAYAQRHDTSHQLDEQRWEINQQKNRQVSFLARVSFVSPALLMQSAMYDIAGAGPARHQHFLEEASRYQREFERFFWPRLFTGTVLSSTEFKDIPRFKYQEESCSTVGRRTVKPLAALTAFGFFFWLAGLRAFRTLPIAAK